MKATNIILLIFLTFLIVSCSNSKKEGKSEISLREKYVNEYLCQIFTEVERKGIEIKDYELSDNEVYDKIFKYWMKVGEQKYNEGKDHKPYFDKARAITDIRIKNNTKGELLFHVITTIKASPDTIHFNEFLFDDKDSLLLRINHH